MEDLLATDGGEEVRATLATALGPDLASYLHDLQGIDGATILPDDAGSEPPLPSPAPSRAGRAAARQSPPAALDAARAGAGGRQQLLGRRRRAIAGTGLPLLANDTHLPALVPSIFYQTHVTFPGADVAGMTIPGEPFAVLGHNRRVAWGVTTLMADQVDFVRLAARPRTIRRATAPRPASPTSSCARR